MKSQYKIGRSSDNDLVISAEHCPDLLAEINYNRGYWVLTKHGSSKALLLNNKVVEPSTNLSKYDILDIYDQRFYWSDYLYEGDRQELILRDFTSFHGRISRANFRALSLVLGGLSICVFFIPGLMAKYIVSRFSRYEDWDLVDIIQNIAPTIYLIGYGLLGIVFILLMIKRMRDAGYQFWKLLVPFYNLYLLYFDPSK